MRRLLVVGMALAVACDRPPPSPGLGADTPISERLTEGTALADTTCQFDRRPLHPDPGALVAEFLRRAGAGEFARAEQWLPSAVDCIGHEPGYDSFSLLDSVHTRELHSSADSASYLLLSRDTGSLDTTWTERVDTLRLYRTKFGWRLATPVFWSWMTPAAYLARP